MRGETSVKISAKIIGDYLSKGRWNTAAAICTKALKHHPSDFALNLLLAKAVGASGNLAQAISIYKKLIQAKPQQADLYAELGLLHSKKNEIAKTIECYQQALAINPNWAELRYNLAVVWHQLGDWESAIASYRQAIAIEPNYTRAYFNLAVLYDQKGQFEEAIEYYRGAIAIEPNYTRAYSNLGSTLAKQNKFSEAIAIYQQGLKIDPAWSTLHNNLGQVCVISKRVDDALVAFRHAITIDPKFALAYYNLGKLWQQQGNYAQASLCLQKAVEIEPNNIWYLSDYAQILFSQTQFEQAIPYFSRAIAISPKFVDAYCQRATVLAGSDYLSKLKQACAEFLLALKQPENPALIRSYLWQTFYYLGEILFEYGGYYQAEHYYQFALSLKPNYSDLYLRLGDCLAKQQRFDAAIAIYHIGLVLEPNHPQIAFQLGKVLEKQHRLSAAIDYYEAVLQQNVRTTQGQWEKLLKLSAPDRQDLNFPQGIYHHTQDWIRYCQLDDFGYVQVTWGDKPSSQKISPQVRPEPVTQLYYESTQTASECGGVTCNSCMKRLIDYFHPKQLSKGVYACSPPEFLPIEPPLNFVVTMPEGMAWIAPQKSEWMICNGMAIITPDGYVLGDLSRYYPWYLPGCKYTQKTNLNFFTQEDFPPQETISGNVAILSGLSAHVYYHWMFDVLPRIEILRRSGINLDEIDWFVVNSIEKPYQLETLKTLGIPKKKIIESDRYPLIKAQQLIVPSFPGHLDWVPPETIEFLRHTFLKKTPFKRTILPERIYISRANAKYRQVLNEEEVTELLSRYGFTTVYLETMTVAEQAALFANARAIVAPHGAGLSNLVFCREQSLIIELFSPNYVRTDYWMISHYLKLKHYYIVGESFDCYPLRQLMYQNSLTEDILVNLHSLTSALQVAGLREGHYTKN
jgi:tetratricopeptide (TPR) repeat protein/capsular polysaccharide biosynthesis protein